MRSARPSTTFPALFSQRPVRDKPRGAMERADASGAELPKGGARPRALRRRRTRRYGRPFAVPLIVTRPGPGKPATLLTAGRPVGATQKTAPSVGCDVSLTGG